MEPPVKELEYQLTMVNQDRGVRWNSLCTTNNRHRRGVWQNSFHRNNNRHLTQSTLLGVPLDSSDSEFFGHSFPSSPSSNSSIITFQNIGPQPKASFSSKAIFNSKSFSKCHSSVSLFAEHCLNERALDHPSLFSTRMSTANPSTFTYITNNTTESSPWNQTGGTGFSIHHSILSHKILHGADPTGLGRWSFIRLKGKHNSTITFISAYRPCRSPNSLGSVWNQQIRYFHLQGISNPDPCSIFDSDLMTALVSWLDAGDNVVLGIDNNDDVRSSTLATRLSSLGLYDAILTQHSPASPPATHNRNTS